MFDGDILNIISIMDPAIAYMFRKFDPVIRMIIDRDSGLLNEYFMIDKGQLTDLYAFATIGRMENDRPQSPSDPKGIYQEEEVKTVTFTNIETGETSDFNEELLE